MSGVNMAKPWHGMGASLLLLAVLATTGGWMAWRYANYSENLLSEAIKISADQVSGAVRVADQQGVSREAIDHLLGRAKGAFDGLFSRTAEAPWLPWRRTAAPARLRGQHAVLLVGLADHYGKIGSIEQQRETAGLARAELEKVIEEEPAEPECARSWRSAMT
jgi:hypothetical protein